MIDPIRAESIRALYAQMRAAGAAATFGIVYIVGVAALSNSWPIIAGWAAAMLGVQIWRRLLIKSFTRANPQGEALEFWASRFVIHQAIAGFLWGLCFFVFAHPEQPVTVSLIYTGMVLIVAGAVPAQAYTPKSFHVLNTTITVMIVVRLLTMQQFSYDVLAAISIVFGLAMRAFCQTQAALVRDGFRIRFENESLLREVTRQKGEADEARHKAEAASLAKSQFLAAASHDLRQPLYALSLFSTSLGELKLDHDGRTVVASIQNSISAMESLFVGLLDVSRLDAGVVKPRLTAVSIDTLFDRLSQYFRPIALERGLDLRLRSDGEWVMSDPTLLEQVLSNLVSNALRCTMTGAVLIAARRRVSSIKLEVWDTGVGIRDSDQERIFDEFVQVDNPERDRRKGLGLGLFIAQRSAELIGGSITLVSQLGTGSCFAIAQPRVSPPSATVQTYGREVATLSRKGDLPVLIVDDDQDVRLALSDLLSRWNVAFDIAADADAALAIIKDGGRYGLVLVDFRLPGTQNGLDLIASIRRDHPSPAPAIVLITGDIDQELINAADGQGVPLFHKPLSPVKLRELVRPG